MRAEDLDASGSGISLVNRRLRVLRYSYPHPVLSESLTAWKVLVDLFSAKLGQELPGQFFCPLFVHQHGLVPDFSQDLFNFFLGLCGALQCLGALCLQGVLDDHPLGFGLVYLDFQGIGCVRHHLAHRQTCCQPLIRNRFTAPTAEKLNLDLEGTLRQGRF